MSQFAESVFIAAGLRAPFRRSGRAPAAHDAVSLSVPAVQGMAAHTEPDLLVTGTVIPNLGLINIAREIWLAAKLNTNLPAFSVLLSFSKGIARTFVRGVIFGSDVMKAPPLHELGAQKMLGYHDAPKVEIKPSEVKIGVEVAGINPLDWYLGEEYDAQTPKCRRYVAFRAIPSSDISGVVESLADYMDGLALDDEVLGTIRFAETSSASYRVSSPNPSAKNFFRVAQLPKSTSVSMYKFGRSAW